VKSLEKRIAALESKPSAVRIGEIIVVGNIKTPTPDILKHIALYPGEVLQYASLRIAEEKLTKLGVFVVDPQKGIRPTVSVLDNEGHFKDILVKVQEPVLERADKSGTRKKNAFARGDSDSLKKPDGKQGIAPQSAPVNLAFREFKDNGVRTVILENSRLIIEPGTKVRLSPVKTEKGNGVRLEWSGVVVEALRMKIETSTQIIEIEGSDEGTFSVRNLQKGAARVGEIIVVGNTKTPHSAICKKMQLVPGDVLDDKALRTAEKNLAAFDATIEVIDTNDPGIKDILVRVKKK
jgi:hypothetical protein